MKIVFVSIKFFVFALFISGCSKLNNDLPAPVESGSAIHSDGWAISTNTNFHGKFLRDNNWDLKSCQKCHSSDYNGGIAPGCMSSGCHEDDMGMAKPPTACNTCHGNFRAMENDIASWAPPKAISGDTSQSAAGVGAHQSHLLSHSISAAITCAECHTVPPLFSTTGHLDGNNIAEVRFNDSLASVITNEPTTLNYSSSLPLFTPAPVFTKSTNSCSNVYCHGYFKNGDSTFTPVWNDTSSSQSECGTCHGNISKPTLAERALPGGTHPQVASCFACHGTVVDANLNFINPSKHINGKLNLFSDERDF